MDFDVVFETVVDKWGSEMVLADDEQLVDERKRGAFLFFFAGDNELVFMKAERGGGDYDI